MAALGHLQTNMRSFANFPRVCVCVLSGMYICALL